MTSSWAGRFVNWNLSDLRRHPTLRDTAKTLVKLYYWPGNSCSMEAISFGSAGSTAGVKAAFK
jgi:hypothetical protein